MIKSVLLLAIFSIFASFRTFTPVDPNFTGKWKGMRDEGFIFIQFDDEGFVTLEDEKEKFGGKDFLDERDHVNLTYEINSSTTPKQIDLVVKRNDTGKETGRTKGIYEFISNDTLKLFLGQEEDAPKSFEPTETIVFHRIKE